MAKKIVTQELGIGVTEIPVHLMDGVINNYSDGTRELVAYYRRGQRYIELRKQQCRLKDNTSSIIPTQENSSK